MFRLPFSMTKAFVVQNGRLLDYHRLKGKKEKKEKETRV
jgi:hypothetical protein